MIECPKIELGQLVTTINGLWTGKKPPFLTVAVIRNTNFSKDCRLRMDDVAMIEVEAKQFATRKLQVGDIIIEKSGGSDKQPVGRPVLFDIPDGDYSFSNFTSTLRVNNQNEILPAYLHKFLYNFYLSGKTAEMQSKTTGLRNLDFNEYKKIKVPVPSIEEQYRIVRELDLLSGIVDKKVEQLSEYDSLIRSIFHGAFGDPVTNSKQLPQDNLGSIIQPKSKIQRASKTYAASDIIHYIDIASIDNKNNILTGTTDYVFSEAPGRAQQVVSSGDVLISMVRPNLKNIAEVTLHDTNLVASTGFCVLRCNEKSSPAFIKCLLLTDSFTNYLLSRVSGANYPAVREDDIRQCRIGIPSKDEQNQFEEKVLSIEKQKESSRKTIAQTLRLLNSRMSCYFD